MAPELAGKERNVIQSVLTGMPVAVRRGPTALNFRNVRIAVLDGRTGQVYYNDPSLHGSTYTLKRTRPAGKSLHYAFSAAPDPISTSTGPSRRVWSNSHISSANGIQFPTYAYGNVTIPCANGNVVVGDEGDIFLGGHSATGVALDAGIQYTHDDPHHTYPDPTDQYQFFMNMGLSVGSLQGWYADPNTYQQSGNQGFRLPCDNVYPFTLGFFVEQAPVSTFGSNVALELTGIDQNPANPYQLDWVYVVPADSTGAYYGWSPTCNGCYLKRVASIAQTAGRANVNLTNGDYFNTTWSGWKISCGFYGAYCPSLTTDQSWDQFHISACDEFPAWTGSTLYNPTDCKDSPTTIPQDIGVTNYSYDGESDAINLFTSLPAGGGNGTTGGTIQGINYGVEASTTVNGSQVSWNFDLIFQNPTASAVQLEQFTSCPIQWSAYNSSGALVWSQPTSTARCLQSLGWSTIAANSFLNTGSVTFTGTPGAQYTITMSFNGYAAYSYTGTLTSIGTAAPAFGAKITMPTAPPVEKTPPPCVHQPCPQ